MFFSTYSLVLLCAAALGEGRGIGNAAPDALVKEKRNSVPAGYVAPSYYPAPPGGWVASWADSYAKAQQLVDNMTLAEKV
jgi:beta-glucosidase